MKIIGPWHTHKLFPQIDGTNGRTNSFFSWLWAAAIGQWTKKVSVSNLHISHSVYKYQDIHFIDYALSNTLSLCHNCDDNIAFSWSANERLVDYVLELLSFVFITWPCSRTKFRWVYCLPSLIYTNSLTSVIVLFHEYVVEVKLNNF